MKSQKLYDNWKKQKNKIDVPPAFADNVMAEIYRHEQKKTKPLFDMQGLIEFISARPPAKAGLIAIGVAAGFIRVAIMIIVILSKGEING